MRLIPSDPDIETILSRIRSDDIDLQPNFQRGEVWSKSKKQKLIDSILRNWHIPPIHVIEDPKTGRSEVLDGQQRLVAIRDFANDDFTIDGTIQPHSDQIAQLNRLHYSQLSSEWKRRFNKFSIRIFSLIDFAPAEPSELFYRLNQPAALTSAEQRNAFFGKPREQVKQLVSRMESLNVNSDVIGFSNSRMAYDDVIARFCYLLDQGRLDCKLTAQALADRYRSGREFSSDVMLVANKSIEILASSAVDLHLSRTLNASPVIGERSSLTLNKASLLSWLIFCARGLRHARPFSSHLISHYIDRFESTRTRSSGTTSSLQLIYTDRVTSRVSDVSSIILRDLILWIYWCQFTAPHSPTFTGPLNSLYALSTTDDYINSPLYGTSEEYLLHFAARTENWAALP